MTAPRPWASPTSACASTIDAPDADDDQLVTLQKLTERYCVVLQTLRSAPQVTATLERAAG